MTVLPGVEKTVPGTGTFFSFMAKADSPSHEKGELIFISAHGCMLRALLMELSYIGIEQV